MTQIFDENGRVIPVTVVEAGPCVVVQKKTVETDGYDAIQVGFGELREKLVNKPRKGHFAKAGVSLRRTLKEFRMEDVANYNVGDEIKVDTFEIGDKVDVSGVSKGKGFQGTIKDGMLVEDQCLTVLNSTEHQVQWELLQTHQELSRTKECLDIWELRTQLFLT